MNEFLMQVEAWKHTSKTRSLPCRLEKRSRFRSTPK